MTERVEAPWLTDAEAGRVMAALAAAGRPARFVGGCVRDALVWPGDDVRDLDLATPERPERVMELLAAAGLRPLPTGLAHGTVSVQGQGRRFEITTLRRDVACFGRRAAVAFTDDFVADAARRDFTINAMSCGADGTLYDPMGGAADLAVGRVRFVGEPRQRIVEDYLRILRFFRFQARFGGAEPDPAAMAACAELAAGVDGLSGERIKHELWRILEGQRPAEALGWMQAAGVLERVVPGAVDLAALARVDECEPMLRLAAAIRPAEPERVAALAARLKLSGAEAERLAALTGTPWPDFAGDARAQRLAIHRLGPALYRDLVRLARAQGRLGDHEAARLLQAADWRAPQFPLTGDDLRALGVAAGPALGRILATIRQEWEASDFTLDRQCCLARAAELAANGRVN